MIALIGLGVVVLLAVTFGSVFGGGNSNSGAPSTGGAGNGTGGGGGSILLDTPSGKAIMENNALPASTRNALESGDENSAAVKALTWIQTSIANRGYNFDNENFLEQGDAQVNLMQRFALASIYYSFNEAVPGWMGEDDVCTWGGVECNGNVVRKLQEGGVNKVSSLAINSMDLEGPIPAEITMLEDLEQLIMFENFLTGAIPKEIFSLKKLEVLDVFNNKLSGSISPNIENLDKLVGLYIGKNEFTGAIPVELFNIVTLVELWLNDLESLDKNPLPNEIGQLVNLEQLILSTSNFEGELPEEISNLVNLGKTNENSNQLLMHSFEPS